MNNCWISSYLTYNIFHFIYIKIYIFILLTDFKYGYGITKSNDSLHKQPGVQGKEDSHFESIDSLASKTTLPTTTLGVNGSSITVGNDTASSFMPSKFNTTITGFYVFVGLSAVIICYFVIKALRLKRRRSKVRRYGILASREDVEMTPLGEEDEDEDSTVFDINEHSRS